jgi:Asp-tRNA(Asn)/Glu-tRNA(Gln) amidotransferase A subunit family amidase
VREAVLEAVRCLERLGAVTEEISLRLVPFAGAIFMALADADGAGVHHRWLRSRPGDYDQGTRRRLLTASLIPAAIQQRAARARALLRAEMREALARLDLLLCPTPRRSPPPAAPSPAARKSPGASSRDAPT